MECDYCEEKLIYEPIVAEIEYDIINEGIYVATMAIRHFCSEQCKNEYLSTAYSTKALFDLMADFKKVINND